ncbi:MAG: asparagine synthase (glutamine-hydrolyzing) [Gemmatimonadales bacterium]
MCGIAGAVGWEDRTIPSRMAALLAHRGPDGAGELSDCTPSGVPVHLAHRRLAIIDLSPAGRQPMFDRNGGSWIVYNGETYNFPGLRQDLEARGETFSSHSDTEVVLRLFGREGPDAFRRLNGIFALAVWDPRRGRLTLARDHFGVKPLYYYHDPASGRLAFASEIKALFAIPDVPRRFDAKALPAYLTFNWVPEPETMFAGIHKLPAGHFAVWEDGKLRIEQYWDLAMPAADHHFPDSAERLTEETRERLSTAVLEQMLSDVPVGAFLSSGLDSSAVAAFMVRDRTHPVSTYTITFPPRHLVGEVTTDDPAIARRFAAQLGTTHHEMVVEPDVAGLLPKLVWHLDEPVSDPAVITAFLVAEAARPTTTVLLSGIGGDELFAGYRKHQAYFLARRYQRMPRVMRERLLEPALRALPSLRGTPLKGYVRLAQKMARSGGLPAREQFLLNCTYFDADERAGLLAPDLRAATRGIDPYRGHNALFDRVAHADFLNQMLYLDMKTFLVSLNLLYNDKMAMASSVETRVPYLSVPLAEFAAARIPPSLKLRGRVTKAVLRDAVKDLLPPEVLRARKAGFGAPTDYWLARELQPMVDDLLSPERVRRRGLFNPAAVAQLVQDQRSARVDCSLKIWQLLTLELWFTTFLDQDPCAR